MEHYSLAEVEEGVLSKDGVPASLPLPPDWGWLAVEGGGAGVGQLVGPAARLARTHRAVVIAGAGRGILLNHPAAASPFSSAHLQQQQEMKLYNVL